MEPVSVFKSGAEAVSLVSALAKLIQETKKADDPNSDKSLQELLARLQIEAVRLSRDLENRLRTLVERVQEYGLNPAQSLNAQLGNLQWYNVITRARLKSLREECHAIYRQLTGFLDDATALLLCKGQQQKAASSFAESLAVKRQLDALFADQNLPLKDVLDGLLKAAGKASAELQTA
jgi:hypothetical protein